MTIERNGEKFSGYNKPKKTPNAKKKYAVLAKQNGEVKLIRFGAKGMEDYRQHKDSERRKRYRARAKNQPGVKNNDKLTAAWWSYHWSW